MLLYNMTAEEIHREITRDLPHLKTFLIEKKNKISRVLREMHRLPAIHEGEYQFPRTHNIWHLLFVAHTKKEIKAPRLQMWSTYESPWGRGAFVVNRVSPDNQTIEVFNFTTHFFKRYQTRYFDSHVGNIYHTIDGQKSFILQNPVIRYVWKDDKHIEGHLFNGIFFGEDMGHGVFLVKTYVSSDMLFSYQQATSEENRQKAFVEFLGKVGESYLKKQKEKAALPKSSTPEEKAKLEKYMKLKEHLSLEIKNPSLFDIL